MLPILYTYASLNKSPGSEWDRPFGSDHLAYTAADQAWIVSCHDQLAWCDNSGVPRDSGQLSGSINELLVYFSLTNHRKVVKWGMLVNMWRCNNIIIHRHHNKFHIIFYSMGKYLKWAEIQIPPLENLMSNYLLFCQHLGAFSFFFLAQILEAFFF